MLWGRLELAIPSGASIAPAAVRKGSSLALQWNFRIKSALIVSAWVAYFCGAYYLKISYVSPTPPPGMEAVLLRGPFTPFSPTNSGFAVISADPKFDELADNVEDNNRSPIVMYEDSTPLGPGHSNHASIRDIGMGRYSHWQHHGFIFSTSDNSDPNISL